MNSIKDDCNQRLLKDNTTAFINYWIQQSPTLQSIITNAESTLTDPSLSSKLLTRFILEGIDSDLRQN